MERDILQKTTFTLNISDKESLPAVGYIGSSMTGMPSSVTSIYLHIGKIIPLLITAYFPIIYIKGEYCKCLT